MTVVELTGAAAVTIEERIQRVACRERVLVRLLEHDVGAPWEKPCGPAAFDGDSPFADTGALDADLAFDIDTPELDAAGGFEAPDVRAAVARFRTAPAIRN